jgi:hypothetical protein
MMMLFIYSQTMKDLGFAIQKSLLNAQSVNGIKGSGRNETSLERIWSQKALWELARVISLAAFSVSGSLKSILTIDTERARIWGCYSCCNDFVCAKPLG